MKIVKIVTLLTTSISMLLLVACAGVGSIGGNSIPGDLYSSVAVPGETTENSGDKTGKACASSILGLVATGDASISAAKTSSGIQKVNSVNYSVDNILGVYATYCTIITGS